MKRTGRRAVLDPMNAMERRIIHLALQDDSGVETHSEGVAPYRRVIIAPRRHRGSGRKEIFTSFAGPKMRGFPTEKPVDMKRGVS